MGRIVKVKQGAGDAGEPAGPAAERVAAEVTEILLAARVAARAEWAAAQGAALLLARKMAEKIVGHAVEVDPAVMGDIVKQALLAAEPRGNRIVLRVHPDDWAALQGAQARWLEAEVLANVRIVVDASVGRYGCVVETPVGRLDARLQTQLEALERVFSDPRAASS